ncbi:alpha/beta fold hydrolase [Opitutaceae bacterium]
MVNEGAIPSVDGMSVVPLFHRALGGVGKPPLIVLHGLLGSSRNWLTTGGDLAAEREVWALDLRNHGKSPHAAEMTYAAMVSDVLAWMDAHGLSQVELIGHSMGGKVSMLLACQHPERVSRLTVVDIAPRAYSSQAHRAEFTAMLELNLDTLQSRGEAELRFEARVADWAMRKFLVTNLDRTADSAGWRWQVNLPVLAEALPVLEANPLTSTDRYTGPVQVIAGGRSRYVRDEDHAAIRQHFPTAMITVIPEAGHNPHMETRAEFVRAVTAK